MSFILENNDMNVLYRTVCENFAKTYYHMRDNKLNDMANIYKPNVMFTFMNDEIIGYNKFLERMYYYGLTKMTHHKIDITAQPINHKMVLISTVGTVSFNNSMFQKKFAETVILQAYEGNKLLIRQSIFKIVE